MKSLKLKDLDFLSQEISLFYYGRTRHSANFGGLLTIIMIVICLIYILYLLIDIYMHSLSSIQFYRYNFDEPQIYSFNNTKGIFHFFQIYNPKNNSHFSYFNSKYIRLFMSNIQEEYKTNPELLSKNDHWVYDDCRDGIDNKFLPQELFKYISFKNGLCLRYYYDSKTKLYYPIEDSQNFKYPYLTNIGMNLNYSISTIIEKCNNNSILTKLFGLCGEENDIDNYFKDNYGINLNILTHEIIPGNYNNEIYNLIIGIPSIMKKDKIIDIKLVFTPLKNYVKKGLFFPIADENITYTFSENYSFDEHKSENNRILSIYNYNLVQTGYIFKIIYQTMYDSFPKIGGIIQLIYYIFFGINYIFNRFKIIDDTKLLFFTLNNEETINGGESIMKFSNIVNDLRKKHLLKHTSTKILKNISEFKKENCYDKPQIKSKLTHNFKESYIKKNIDLDNSKSQSIFPFISEKNTNSFSIFKNVIINNMDNISDSNDKNDERSLNLDLNHQIKEEIINRRIDNISKNKNQSYKYTNIREKKRFKSQRISKKSFNKNYFQFGTNNNNLIDNDILNFKILLRKYFNYKKKNFLYEKMTVDKINHFFTNGNYIASLFCYKEPINYYLTMENFRKKLLSEEHFFRMNNYLYLFEKYFDLQESKKIDIIELYKHL